MTFLKNIRNDLVLIVIIVSVASGIIFYRFTDIPRDLHFDEVEFARLALSLDGKPYTPYSPLATGHSTLYFYLLLFSMKIFGVNASGLRFPAALFGILTTIVFYYVMKQVFSKEKNILIPFASAIIFVTLRWYFNFARFSFEATFLFFLEFISIFSFFRFLENKKYIWIIISGVFAGMAYNSYTPGRFFFSLPLLFLILNISIKNLFTWKALRPVVLYLISFIIIILPLTVYLSINKDTRIDQLFFIRNHEMTVAEKAQGVWQNITGTLGMFHIKGDVNGVHNYPNKPILNPVIGILFVAGLILSIIKWKNFYNKFFITYFVLSIFPTILTYPWENPHMLRTITAIPSLVYFVTLALLYLMSLIKNKKLAIAGMALLIMLSAVYEIRTYFLYHAPVLEEAFRMHKELPYYIKHPDAKL